MLDILFPKMCVECGKYGDDVCFACVKKIEKVKVSTCFYCGKISKDGKICAVCKKNNETKIDSIITSAIYDEGPTKEMVHYLKYCGYSDLSCELGELIVERLKYTNYIRTKNLLVVPVPMHKNREIKRGYNHAELLARYVSKQLDLHGGVALEKVAKRPQQMGLRRDKRMVNLKDSIDCIDCELVLGREILLIDDVATTGATLNECARALKVAGAKRVYAVEVARG